MNPRKSTSIRVTACAALGALAVFAAACSSDTEADPGSGGTSGNGGASANCLTQNPEGCQSCGPGTACKKPAQCAPSDCKCVGIRWKCGKLCDGKVCLGTESCSAKIDEIAKTIPTTGACTAVVRLKLLTLEPIAHTFVCGPAKNTTPIDAHITAELDTGFEAGPLISGATADDAWVFHNTPSDFGDVAVVSAVTGKTLLGGTVIWLGSGKVTYPKDWTITDIDTCA